MMICAIFDTGIASVVFGESRAALTATANATTTFLAMAASAAAGDRFIAVAVSLNSDLSLAVTVNGGACTKVVGTNNGVFFSEIWVSNAAVPTGTTVDVVLSGTHVTNIRVAASTFAMYGVPNPTVPSSSGTDITSTYDIALTIPTNGIAIGSAVVNAITTWSWSSFTKTADAQFSPITYTSALRNTAGSITETVTPGSAGTAVFVAAAWSP